MKLYKAINEQVPELSMEELLQMENDFLRDELEIVSLEHDLELCQTVLKCIEEEGDVSKSIEVMFGESFTDVTNAKDELGVQIESISNELLGKLAEKAKTEATFGQLEAMLNKLGKLKREDFDGVEFTLDLNLTSRLRKMFNAVKIMGETLKSVKVDPSQITVDTIVGLISTFKETIQVVSDKMSKSDLAAHANGFTSVDELLKGISEARAGYRFFDGFIRKHWVQLYRQAIPKLKESGIPKDQLYSLIAEGWRLERLGV